MTPIQRTPWRYYLGLALTLGGFFSVLLVVIGLIRGVPIGWLLFIALVIFAALTLFASISAPLVYPPVSVDVASRTVRMRSRDVPISSITQAWRRIAIGKGSRLIFYRLQSADGPKARLIVAGYGFPVLDVAGRQALIDLLRIAPIEEPARRAGRDSQRWQRVGIRQMLAELPALEIDLTVGVDEETLRRDAALDGRDPDAPPMLDERLR